MKFSINKEELKKAITIASKALSKNVIQVERGHLLVNIADNKAIFSGTNNDLKASVEISLLNCESDTSFLFTVDPKILNALITKIDLEIISFDFNVEDLTLKVITSEDGKSFNTLQSFPTSKMLTVDSAQKPLDTEHIISTSILRSSLDFCQNYLEMKEENKRFDFVIFNKGVVFGSNGLNKMGFFVSSDFKEIENFKIRKIAVPLISSILNKIESKTVLIGEHDNSVVVKTRDSQIFFSCLKSSVESPKISLDMLKKGDPYTVIERVALNKKIKRLLAAKTALVGSGIELTLDGAGDNATLQLALLANLKAQETVQCSRVDDPTTEDITHIVDCKLFQSIIDSFEDKNISLYINTQLPYFKIHEVFKNEENDTKCMKVGVGSYSRIVKNR